jgi:hypothetical protein
MAWAAGQAAHAQNIMAGLQPRDLTVLESRDPRKELPCTVTPSKPALGFDLRFHAGYEVAVPLKELAGTGDLLTIVFRVTPAANKDHPAYFTQSIRVPRIAENAKGDSPLDGWFDLGEGKYHVDWLMRDRRERMCSFYWDAEASLPDRDKDLGVVLPPGQVRPAEEATFKAEPPAEKSPAGPPLYVKVLVNFAPQNPDSSVLQPLDVDALISMLRNIARDPRVERISIVAFSLHERRVLYRQDAASGIDFPALGQALDSLNLGAIDLQRLSQKHGDTQFLAELVRQETAGPSRPDALVFAGPKVLLEQNVPEEELKETGQVGYPVYYLNYNLNPANIPWRDAIGNVVKFFKGDEYTVSRPRDLWFAVKEMVSRIAISKTQRQARMAVR